ncbi:UDP-N-acetylmuramate dehydrogenase [Candidatus Roizmanbacteria bacterium]|nr:UDP-N-acetylmuramate dehydrogenase [Candidatus Roizmanbacteria bacterium]
MNTHEILSETLGKDRVLADKNLFSYLTLRTSTVAEYFFEAHTKEDLLLAIRTAKKLNIPFTMIGGGSNIAATKNKIPGLVIKNNYANLELIKDEKEYAEVLVSSGYTITLLVNKTIEKGWGGFEHHEGLPGTMGGAIYMNSKWTHPWSYVSDPLISANLLDASGELKTVTRDYFNFAYDYSILQKTHEVFIDGVFRLEKKDPAILKEQSHETMLYRRQTQPFGEATCGCFFRNISKEDQDRLQLPTSSSGYLIDQVGMKNKGVGAFVISPVHANFIINTGKMEGNTADLLQLVKEIKEKVSQKFGIQLVEEVVVV